MINRRDKGTHNGFREQMVKAMIDELGGPAEAARKLQDKHDQSALGIAIEILGGVPRAAEKLGISRQHLDRMMIAGPYELKGRYLDKIFELTGIPVATLLKSGPIEKPEPVLSGPAVRKAAKRKVGK